ncbi:MAG: M15 family metallopeptidase [Treponema sp.]
MQRFIFFCFLFCSSFIFAQEHLHLPRAIGHIPSSMLKNIEANEVQFVHDLEEVLKEGSDELFTLVDKEHLLSNTFVPYKLIELKTGAQYTINRKGLLLTPIAESALSTMAKKARVDGVTLLVSSAFRSYEYQNNLFNRYVKQYGENEADRFSARPNASQHRLGTAVDFGSIDDAYAETKAGKWLVAHAEDYGWSLSYPKGYENITGYKWECWHYRYLGIKTCKLQKKYFGDIQQYMLEFINYWQHRAI